MFDSSYFMSGLAAKELKMATFMSAKHPVNRGILPHSAKKIAAETGGSLNLKLYP
jgi:TRAP-type C4-dicarboxylate transport system substrate-binding protein